MDHIRYSKFKAQAALILALVMMSACSSSKVDDSQNATPPETAGDPAAAASTDAVPAADPNAVVAENPNLATQAAPGSLDASANPPAVNPADSGASSVAGGPPAGDPSTGNVSAVIDNTAAVAPMSPDASVGVGEPAVVEKHSSSPSYSDSASSAPAQGGEGVHYRVKRGDTLMKIAFENYGDLYRWKEIYEANRSHIADPNAVPPGTDLVLNGAGMVTIERNGEQYLIKHGDTLGKISNNVYGTTNKWKKLWENNRQLIKNPNKIYAGFYLYYQPEARLTHDKEAPAVIDGDSAANKKAPTTTETAQAQPQTPAQVTTQQQAANTPPANTQPVQAQPAAQPAIVRTPASK